MQKYSTHVRVTISIIREVEAENEAQANEIAKGEVEKAFALIHPHGLITVETGIAYPVIEEER